MTRDIIIGDIHGCWAELETLLHQLDVTDADRVISVGDLVDRGPDSEAVWDYFQGHPNRQAIMGNHERKHVRAVLSYSQDIVRLQLGERYEAFRAWAAALPYYLETEHAIVVHGGFEDGVPLEAQREDVLAATTSGSKYLAGCYPGQYWPDLYRGERPIVFGHHIVGDTAKRFGNHVYGIDTGACHGGYLTALVLPGFELHRVRASRDHWAEAQPRWQLPVLASRPWPEYRFHKIERVLSSLPDRADPAQRNFVQALEAWVGAVKVRVPSIIDAVHARHLELERSVEPDLLRRRIAAEPLAPLLFGARAGSLDAASVLAHLSRPGELLEAARSLDCAEGIGDWRPPPGSREPR